MVQVCGIRVIKQTIGLASPIGDNPKEYWFYSKVLGNQWLANSIRIIVLPEHENGDQTVSSIQLSSGASLSKC